MYLKRLDAQGFKSFANKTTLDFGPGVTCIVGPNGTGKTNVADSIRWVLGEHARAAIRARKTEDVIFAGSDKRAAMGVAEVNITLDNSGGWLPIDYHEVVVTRRAYRSGDNEYLINNTKVRLRDVVELFQRAQVGQNSYAFMGQGMVEQVLSLRPEDRRGLIEEAADVRIYRNKLEDAQSKLKATRENMDRVRMLVREIEPRITQLERQAGRAVRYHELTKELAATLHAWFSHQWREVNEQVLAAITTHDQRTEELEHARGAAKACEDGLGQLRAAIDERKREVSVRDGRLANLRDYARDLERRAALDSERARMLAHRITELNAELGILRDELATHEALAAPVVATDVEARLAAERSSLDEQRARLVAIEQQMVGLQRSALTNEQSAARARAMSDDLGRRASDAAEAVRRLEQEEETSAAERARAIADLAEWARGFAAICAERASVLPRIEPATRERQRALEAAASARQQAQAGDDELRELRSRADEIRIRMELLETMDAPAPAPDAGVRAILEAGGVIKRDTIPPDIELDGIVGLIGQMLRVPSGLEKAIEAALADNLFAIVVERQADARAAVQLLLENDAGRATVYPLDTLQEARALNLIKEKGVLGVASALVKCDSRYRKLVDTLLGRTIVVEDLGVAYRIVRRGLAGAVATLDGVLLKPVGSVAAGSLMAVQTTFAVERQHAELPESLESLQSRIAGLETDQADHARRAAQAEVRAEELAGELETLRNRRSELDAAAGDAKAAFGALKARLHALTEAGKRRDAEFQRLASALSEIETDRERCTREALAAEEREQQERRSIAELETARHQAADAVAELAATVAQLDGEYRTERHSTAGERAARERLDKQITTKEEQLAQSQQEAQTIGGRLEATQRELGEKNVEVAALAADLEPARQELAQLESRERTLSAELVEANARLRDAERMLMEAANDARARRDELEVLRQTLEAEGFTTTDAGDVERLPEPEPERDDGSDDDAPDDGGPPTWLRSEDDDLPLIRGGSTVNATELRDRIADLRAQIRNLGPVNEQAATDYADNRERFDFLSTQLADLQSAEASLREAIDELEGVIREKFRTTFKVVNREFERYFSAFFRGGTARLELGETDDDGLPGIEIIAQPPGKKLGSMALLSGGERSLTAVALLFALLQANPSPICVLDEVDAALDEANVGRFVEELRALAERTQFVIITHNRRTIEQADTIYGVSMGADNVSRVLSLKLADIPADG